MAVCVRIEAERGYAVVRAGERIDRRSVPALRAALDKALRGHGKVLLDATGVQVAQPLGAALLPAALARSGGWPVAKLAVFGAGAGLVTLLRRTRASQLVPVFATEDEAATGVDRRPPWVWCTTVLPLGPSAPAGARAAVGRACLAWRVPAGVRDAAALIASELVTNAVRRPGTGARLTVERTHRRLAVTVRDFAPGPAARPDATTSRDGLAVVAALAQHWGVLDTPEGNLVWARLALPSAGPS